MNRSLFILLLVLVTGCSSLGPQLTKIKSPPRNKALVYVYRPSAFTGSIRSPYVVFNDKKVGVSPNGSYFSFLTDEGVYTVLQKNFAGEKLGDFKAKLKKGRTYFLRIDLSIPTSKYFIDSSGNFTQKLCPFMGLNLTLPQSKPKFLSSIDKRAQNGTCWPGFMFVARDFAENEIYNTKLSK